MDRDAQFLEIEINRFFRVHSLCLTWPGLKRKAWTFFHLSNGNWKRTFWNEAITLNRCCICDMQRTMRLTETATSVLWNSILKLITSHLLIFTQVIIVWFSCSHSHFKRNVYHVNILNEMRRSSNIISGKGSFCRIGAQIVSSKMHGLRAESGPSLAHDLQPTTAYNFSFDVRSPCKRLFRYPAG